MPAVACVCSSAYGYESIYLCTTVPCFRVCACARSTWQRLVSDEAACFSQQPPVCAQETINKEGISWTIAARLAPCAPWELEEEEERGREGRFGRG